MSSESALAARNRRPPPRARPARRAGCWSSRARAGSRCPPRAARAARTPGAARSESALARGRAARPEGWARMASFCTPPGSPARRRARFEPTSGANWNPRATASQLLRDDTPGSQKIHDATGTNQVAGTHHDKVTPGFLRQLLQPLQHAPIAIEEQLREQRRVFAAHRGQEELVELRG